MWPNQQVTESLLGLNFLWDLICHLIIGKEAWLEFIHYTHKRLLPHRCYLTLQHLCFPNSKTCDNLYNHYNCFYMLLLWTVEKAWGLYRTCLTCSRWSANRSTYLQFVRGSLPHSSFLAPQFTYLNLFSHHGHLPASEHSFNQCLKWAISGLTRDFDHQEFGL